MKSSNTERQQSQKEGAQSSRPNAAEGQAKKEFVAPKLERHETLPDVTGFTF